MDRLDQSQKKNGLLGPESFFAWTTWTRVIFCLDRLDQSHLCKKFDFGPSGPSKIGHGPSGPSHYLRFFSGLFEKK